MGKKSRRPERQKQDKPVPLEHRLMDRFDAHKIHHKDGSKLTIAEVNRIKEMVRQARYTVDAIQARWGRAEIEITSETYTFDEGTPDWMYRVPPFRMLDPGDHMMDRYVKHAKTWAEAAKAGVADVE